MKAVAREDKYSGNVVKEGTCLTHRGQNRHKMLGSLSISSQDSMCYLQLLAWLFYRSRKDRKVGAEITFLPGKLLHSSGLAIIEIELLTLSCS